MRGRPSQRIRWPRAALPIVLLALASNACDRQDRPSVVLILIDQLRADRLETLGAATGSAPELDALAREGFYFERGRSPAPWTYPSVCSLHTGLYPRVHQGVRRATRRGQPWITRLPDPVLTLAEVLGQEGYVTAGFVANPYLKPESNFSQGFGHYEHDFVKSWLKNPSAANDWWQESSYANSVNPRVRRFVEESLPLGQPLFVYVHYIDVHGPWDYAPFEVASDEVETYDSATRYVSEKVHDLFEFLAGQLDGNLLFVITSDHGRALLPGDESTELIRVNKQSLHDFNLHVPLIFARTKAFPWQGHSRVPVSLVDVYPTLLGLLGLGVEDVDGLDLSPLFAGGEIGREWLAAEVEEKADRLSSEAIISDRVKFVHVGRPQEVYFEYDLSRDPSEMAPALEALGPPQEEKRRLLDLTFENLEHRAFEAEMAPFDQELRQRLRSLGYVH
jgi:arylsulfatase A-like enzyme